MIEGRWNIVEQPYSLWKKENKEAERLVICGDISVDDVVKALEQVDYCSYKEIEVSELNILKSANDYTLADCLENYDLPMPGIIKVVLNRDLTPKFMVEDKFIYSSDRKGLIHVPAGLSSLVVPAGIEYVGAFACYCCCDIKSLVLPYGLKSIGERAFCQADGFVSCELPDTVTSLGTGAFALTDLEHVKLPANIEVIPYGCFELAWLEDLNIPASVRKIESHAFHGNPELRDIVVPEGVESIGYNVFAQCNSINLPSTLKDIAPDFYFEELVDDPDVVPKITISEDNPVFYTLSGRLYFRDTGKLAIGWNLMKEMVENKTYHW